MATSFHVSGPALIFRSAGYSVLGGDSPPALTQLGISVDGVGIEISDYYDPIKADTGGPQIPVAEQGFGMDAVLSMKLEIYDEAQLLLLRKRPGAGSEGVLESIGRVLAAADYHRIHVDGATDGPLPWNWPTCRLMRPAVKVGTMRNVWDIQLYAFAYVGTANSAAGAVLYDRVTTGHP